MPEQDTKASEITREQAMKGHYSSLLSTPYGVLWVHLPSLWPLHCPLWDLGHLVLM